MSCSAVLCSSRTTKGGVKDPEFSFHEFPKCPEIRGEWIRAIRRGNWEPKKHSRLCSKHFEKSCFVAGLRIKRLKSDAVPTIFERYQQPVQHQRKTNSEKAISSTENYGKYFNLPPCDECQKPVDARELYRCVQCPLVVMCADCGRNNAHAHHCVLRMPSLEVYIKVEYLFKLLTDVFLMKLSQKNVDGDTNDDDDDDDNYEDNSDYDDKEEEIKQEFEISVHEDNDDDQNQTAESATSGPSKKLKSSASTFLSSRCDEASAPEPLDADIQIYNIKTEPDTDPLACPSLFNILHTSSDEPKPKKRRITKKKAPIKDNATEINCDVIGENRPSGEHEEVVKVKLEPPDSDATLLVDTERYASYGSHRAGNTNL